MSLVNYGSSDDSSDEDSPQTQNVSGPKRTQQDSQADQDKLAASPPPSIRPKPDNGASADRPRPLEKRKRSLLSSLPPPKSSTLIKGFPAGKQDIKELAEVDSSTTNIKTSFLNLPPPKKKSHKVKITLPSLPDPGSDDEEPVAKKPVANKGVSGLLSMLPKPRSAMSSRILVPHTVSRKPTLPKPKPQVKPAPKKTNTTVPKVISGDYASDDDDVEEEGGSFFSLGASTAPVLTAPVLTPQVLTAQVQTAPVPTAPVPEVSSSSKDSDKLKSKMPLPSLPTVNTDYLKADSSTVKLGSNSKSSVSSGGNIIPLPESSYKLSSSSTSSRFRVNTASAVSSSISTTTSDVSIVSTSHTDSNTEQTSNSATDCNPPSHNIADAPLSFNASHSSIASGYGQVTSSYYGNYDYGNNYYQEGQSSYEYNQPYQDSSGYACPDTTEAENTQQGNVQETNNEDDDEFRKFLGKKRGREDLNMISINADDQTAGSNTRESLLKSISEEQQPMSYSKKKNSDLPSSQQRRKHQITYLAFQAKERELALKNQWSQNRQTRKQTQAKYGF